MPRFGTPWSAVHFLQPAWPTLNIPLCQYCLRAPRSERSPLDKFKPIILIRFHATKLIVYHPHHRNPHISFQQSFHLTMRISPLLPVIMQLQQFPLVSVLIELLRFVWCALREITLCCGLFLVAFRHQQSVARFHGHWSPLEAFLLVPALLYSCEGACTRCLHHAWESRSCNSWL